MFKRSLQPLIENRFFQGKAIVVIGPRQVGKTTLLRMILKDRPEKSRWLDCDDPNVRALFGAQGAADLQSLIGDSRFVVIDEAQRVPEVGLVLKRIIDNFPNIQLLVTGSSSLELTSAVNEPLTGRKFEFRIFPISMPEIEQNEGLIVAKSSLDQRLVFGSYPDVVNHPVDAKERIVDLADSYLYKDILSMDGLKRPELLHKLLCALALQLGQEVSFNELSQLLGADHKTIEKYVDLLEKSFVLFRLTGLSRNLRNELKKTKKIYFTDVGIRNAILRNFAPLALRQDVGALWENFYISERLKSNQYKLRYVNSYFWRTTDQQEIDYIEESDGQFSIYELKSNPKTRAKFPKAFLNTYPVREKTVVTPENYLRCL